MFHHKHWVIIWCSLVGINFVSPSLVRKSRAPRPQWTTLVKTTSYTTVSTTTVCYVSTNTALAACGKKKKRSIFEHPVTGEIVELTPSKPDKGNLETDLDLDEFHIDGSEDVLLHGEDDEREPRFVNLGFTWSTTTSTKKKTTTSYTSTSILCTPSGWTVSGCG